MFSLMPISAPLSDLTEIIDGSPFVGLALAFVHTGYNASIEWRDGEWSPQTFGSTASEAIAKCVRLHGPPAVPVVKIVPPPPY